MHERQNWIDKKYPGKQGSNTLYQPQCYTERKTSSTTQGEKRHKIDDKSYKDNENSRNRNIK